ncbi:phage tail tape measure protein [Pseudoalteromonas sp. NEC-BIFX-2020_002]|uniref:phage tail tape measure protein n=1 Tax=Pseudoalteromonas sp. NEC-BIFX-2020_002 TaxID=2732353 RepID=UPI002017BE0B|nr:phage tail tape measure protein [Pseudoalteromonas sp. NEC-BIFX-2020_002]
MATLSKLDKLTYSIGIIDKVTGPVNKVMAKINQLSQQTAAAQDQMMRGAATAVGGGYALAKSLAPAIDQAAALGEVKSLGVVDESLQKLNKTSLEFTANFGGNASDFVRSAYDIQSAMSGITGDELSKVTEISNTLAKATKADAATVTDYMGTMYGVFKSTADKMGKVKWAEDIAGITAKAVTDYKTDGKEMASAFSALGASSSAPLAEQIAVMGRLQSTMSGSESATKYKAFEAGAGKAQKALGLDFTDSSGKLLPMVDILQKINEKTNGLTKQADIDAIATAFGSAEASSLIKLLITDIDGLNNQVQDLGSVSGMANVAKMADDMRTPWNKLSGSFNAASIALGQRLLPVVEPFVEMLAAGFAGIVSLTERFPFLSSVIATLVVVIVALITVHGIIIFTMGLYKMALVSSAALTGGLTVLTKLWQGALIALRVLGFLSLIATMGAAAIAMGTFKAVMLAGQAATWLFNAALWANPITWVVAGVIALIAAVGALIYYWDDLVAAFQNTAWGKVLMAVFDSVKAAFNGVIDSVKWVLEKLGLIDDTEAKIKTEATSTHENINRAQPSNLVMQNADQAFSRDYGQAVINKAAQVPDNTASTHYAAMNDATFVTRTQLNESQTNNAINSALQNSQVIEQTNSARAQTNGLNNSAINSVVANAHTNAVTTAANDAVYSTSAKTANINNSVINSAVNDAVYSTSTVMSNATNPTLQNSIATNQTSNTNAQTSALNNNAVNSVVANAQINAVTMAANDAAYSTSVKTGNINNSGVNSAVNDVVYSTSTAMSNAANSTLQNSLVTNQTDSTLTQISALNNSAINSAVNDAVYSTSTTMSNAANPTLQNSLVTNQTDSALTQTSALNNSAINSAVNDAVYSTSTAMSNAANSTLQNSIATNQSHNALTQTSALNNRAVNSVVANAPTNAVTMFANDAAYSTSAKTANINNSGINSVLQNNLATDNYAGHIAQSTLFAPQSAPQNTVASTANNFTNAANSRVYSRKHVQLTRVNQGAAPLQPLPEVKTDQAITNVANASAYKVDQLSTEQQQQSNSYKAKVQKSAFLQNLTSNTHNSSSSSDSDNRKSVHIDSLTIKSDDIAQSFEQMMELAG